MGKKSQSAKLKHKKKKLKQQKKSNDEEHAASSVSNSKFTVDQLLDKAEEYIDSFEYSMAYMFCQRALEQEPDNLRALETSGTLLLEQGDDLEAAKHCFGRAVELSPNEGHSKYMYLGQLFTGAEAIQCFQKGIELMQKMIADQGKLTELGACAQPPEPEVKQEDISSAYCSVAEIYLTDECFADDAEQQCKECLDKALAANDSNPEAYQLYASYWLSKDNKQSAKEMINKCVSLWLPQLKEADKSEGGELDPVQVCPVSYPSRLNAAKLLIEVEEFECATDILELLLDEIDVVEVWYLLGWVNYLQGEDYKGNARYYLQRAKEVATKKKFDDHQMVQHIEELLEELGPEPEEDAKADEDDEDEASEDDMESDSEAEGQTDKQDISNAMEH